MFKVKLVILGPCKSGKTVISNFLADASDISGKEYHPTKAVRILEFESNELDVSGRMVKADIELWDCSGNKSFEHSWPAILNEANGIVFVYNPDQSSHPSEVNLWRKLAQEVHDRNCLLLSNLKPETNATNDLQSHYPKMMTAEVNLDQDPDGFQQIFNRYVEKLVKNLAEGRDRDELNIMSETTISP